MDEQVQLMGVCSSPILRWSQEGMNELARATGIFPLLSHSVMENYGVVLLSKKASALISSQL
jgi:hypothetical protein